MYDTLATQPGPTFLLFSMLDSLMGNNDGTTLYITVIKAILDLFAEIDGNVDAAETEFINDYIAML